MGNHSEMSDRLHVVVPADQGANPSHERTNEGDLKQGGTAVPPKVLVVAYGVGVDSTAMLIGMAQRGERPDLILTADTGDEKPETYAYIPIMNAWLAKAGFPAITVVKNARPKSLDTSLAASCERLGTLPSLAYGSGAHQCSLVWKRDPQIKFVKGGKLIINGERTETKGWQPAKDAWARGEKIVQCIGYDNGPRDSCRAGKAMGMETPGYINRYPLIEWGWDRERCIKEIEAAGLPVPMKSACFHCPASKKTEIDWLAKFHPELTERAVAMERKAIAGGGFRGKGLGRSFSWGDYLNK